MRMVKLLSWHEEVAAKAKALEQKGVQVDAAPLVRTSAVVGEMARLDLAALVLDLDRLASNSREIALMLRASKSARHIPILLAGSMEAANDGGLPAKYARLRAELPDIPYAAWPEAKKALTKLLEVPAGEVHVVPMERVYTASLAQKMGVLPGKAAAGARQVALMGAPEGFVPLLGDLPGTVKLTGRIGSETALAICFIRGIGELAAVLEMLSVRLPVGASAWIVYPRRAAKVHRDFNENDVREQGIAAGFVDYKICSVDGEWSGMKFARRKG